MQEVSELLNDAINSIIDVKEESDIDSLFSAGGTSALMSEISGLDDFRVNLLPRSEIGEVCVLGAGITQEHGVQ